MPIKFRCPQCRQFLGISRSKAGALTDCPTCGRTIRIPDLDGQVQPLPKPELNLGDSELAGALDALARLDAVEAHEASPSPAGAVGEASIPKPQAVAVAEAQNVELAPAAEPIPLEPSMPAEQAHSSGDVATKGTTRSDAAVAASALDEIIRLNPAEARAETKPRDPVSITALTVAIVGGAVLLGIGVMIGWMTAHALDGNALTVDDGSAQSSAGPGESSPSDPIPAEPDIEAVDALTGRLTYATVEGGSEPDNGARIIVLPKEREGTAKLNVVGFRAGAGDVDQVLARTSIRALGGAYTIADDQGHYTVRLAAAGTYRVLFVSRFQPRDDAEFLEPNLQDALSEYFDRPAALIGPVAYEFAEFTFRGDEAELQDHVFQRE